MFNKLKNILLNEDEKIKGSLFGFFVGDALGVPVEFVKRDELKKRKVTKMLEYGTHNQPLGTWSDDTSMVIATIDSLNSNQCLNYKSIMDNFLKWFNNGEYTPNGIVFDIGNTTSMALLKYQKDKTSFLCGSEDIYSNGNGSLMRILPISIYLHYTDAPMFDVIKNISSMTHAHIYSIFSCIIYSVFINEYLKVPNIKKSYASMQVIIRKILEDDNNKTLGNLDDLKQKFNRIIYHNIADIKENDLKSSGFVIDSLEACFWCLLNTNNYQGAVLKAVNLGDDTDTIGALTGGLAGLIYGYRNIPKDWVNVLKRKEYLNELVNKFIQTINTLKSKKALHEWPNNLNQNLNSKNTSLETTSKTTAESWQCLPFSKSKTIKCHIELTKEEYEKLSLGYRPQSLEDHWFMYCTDTAINYFRSWTGIQIFKGHYKFENNTYLIYSLEINDNREEYFDSDTDESLKVFTELVKAACKKNKIIGNLIPNLIKFSK